MRWSKVFENRLITFGDMGFLLVQFTGWKWEISNLVDGLSFQLVHCKSKIPAPHLNFSGQMPTFNTVEMQQIFWKSVKYLWRYGIFAGTVYSLKVGNFKPCWWAKFSPCHCKTKIQRTWNFLRNAHFQHVWDEAKFLKIGLIPLEI